MDKDFLETLKERGRKSKVYTPYQLLGLEISQILEDEAHKSLYIKLAKERDAQEILSLARSVRDRKNVKNKGAYFMKLLSYETRKKSRSNSLSQRPRRRSIPSKKNARG